MHPLTRKNNSTIMTTNPSFSFFLFFSSTTLTVRKNVTDFVICPPEYMSRVTAHDVKLLELLSLLFT